MEDKNQKLPSTRIQCEKPIYRNFRRTVENTRFLVLRLLHISENFEKERLII